MLVNCNRGCSGKRSSTNASLDVDANQVICDFCGDEIAVSSFTKNSMKQRGDIIRTSKKKPFQFDCKTCNKSVPCYVDGNNLKGVDCKNECTFEVSKFIIHGMQQTQKTLKKLEDSEDDNKSE